MTELLRELRPGIVLAASPSDYICDHEAISQLVRDACFTAPIPNYTALTQSPPVQPYRICTLWILSVSRTEWTSTYAGFTVDIAPTFETKRAVLAKHQSQKLWLQWQHGVDDYLGQMESWTHACGARAGIVWGVSFRQYKIHPYPQNPLLQQILFRYLANPKR